jgi:hypothetical protein
MGRRSILFGAALCALSQIFVLGGTTGAQDREERLASWSDGNGDCGVGDNGTGFIANFNIPAQIVRDGKQMTISFVDNATGSPIFTPVKGMVEDDGSFVLRARHDQNDEDYTFRGRVKSDVIEGTFTRLAHYNGDTAPRCTAKWAILIPTAGGDTDKVPGKDNDQTICQTRVKAGYAEPTQGVWQNDPTFEDRADKQQREITPTTYVAELAMAQGRPTVLVGKDRKSIGLTGTTTGTSMVRVKMRFTSHGPALGNLRAEERVTKSLPIGPPCREKQSFSATVSAAKGVPTRRGGAFEFQGAGKYRIEIQLVAGSAPIPGRVVIRGESVSTGPLNIIVVPVFLDVTDCVDTTDRHGLQASAEATVAALNAELSDYYPLAPGSVQARVGPEQCVADFVRKAELNKAINSSAPPVADALGEELTRQLVPNRGAERVVAMLRGPDWKRVDPVAPRESFGYAATANVVIVPRYSVDDLNVRTAAHELAHTFAYPWGADEARALCGPPNYHNKPGVGKIADGIRITHKGKEDRQRVKEHSIFQGTGESTWIDQCTYFHLLKELS